MMAGQPASHPMGRRALRLVGLLMVLAGLFGMHGLDTHGAAGMETVPRAAMAEMPMSEPVPDVNQVVNSLAADSGPVLGLAQRTAEAFRVRPPMGMDMSMAMICLAVLAATLIALLRLLLGRRTAPVLALTGRRLVTLLPSGRDPDPPSLIVLSIQRC